MKQLLDELGQQLMANRDELKGEQMTAYMQNQSQFIGVQAPMRKAIAKPIIQASGKCSIDESVKLIHELWKLPYREYQLVGIDILMKVHKKLKSDHIKDLESWILTKSWWDTVDFLASRGVGQVFKDEALKSVYIDKWLSDENIWLNRTCLIYQLFYREQTDVKTLERCIVQLMHKQEFFIQKAIGWSLRQYSKTNPKWVQEFVINHSLKGLAKREALKWMNSRSKIQ